MSSSSEGSSDASSQSWDPFPLNDAECDKSDNSVNSGVNSSSSLADSISLNPEIEAYDEIDLPGLVSYIDNALSGNALKGKSLPLQYTPQIRQYGPYVTFDGPPRKSWIPDKDLNEKILDAPNAITTGSWVPIYNWIRSTETLKSIVYAELKSRCVTGDNSPYFKQEGEEINAPDYRHPEEVEDELCLEKLSV